MLPEVNHATQVLLTLGAGNRFEAETTISSCACERPACSEVLYLTAPKYERN